MLDALVWLGSRRTDAGHLVRLVRFGDGTQIRMYLTNVTDPFVLSLAEIPQLYARRWDMELAFRLLKDYLGMHHWWSSKPELIKVQIWVVLILSQVILALRERIARSAGCDLFDISVPLLIAQLPDPSASSLPLLDTLLREGEQRGILRPHMCLSFSLQVPRLSLEEYQPAPPDLQRQRTPHYRIYTPRVQKPHPSGYRKKREKAEANRRARTKAGKTATSAPGTS